MHNIVTIVGCFYSANEVVFVHLNHVNSINHAAAVSRVKSAVESILHLIPSKNMVPKTTTSINKPTGDKIETSTYLNFVRDRICGNVSLLDIDNREDLINYTNKTPKNCVPQK